MKEANMLFDQGQNENALIKLNILLYNEKNHFEALRLRGMIFNNLRKHDEALTDFISAYEIDQNNKEILYMLGSTRYNLGQYDLALKNFEDCLAKDAGETNIAFFKMDLRDKGATGISTMNSIDADLWNFIGLCHLGLEKYGEAIDAFCKGLQIDITVDLLLNRANVYGKTEEFEKAKLDYQQAMALFPENEMAMLNLLRLEDNDDEISSWNLYIAKNPNNYLGYAERGLALLEAEKYALAEKDLEIAQEMNSLDLDVTFNLGLCKTKTKKYDEAIMIFENLIEKEPNIADYYFNLGNIYYSEKEFKNAISYYTLAISIDSDNSTFIYNRALAYYADSATEQACKEMNFVLKTEPEMAAEFIQKCCSEY